MVNSTFNPATINEFDKSKITIANQGVSGICLAGTSGVVDLDLADDMLLTGIQVLAKGSCFGDTLMLEVVDKVGTLPGGLALPPNTVLSVFGQHIYISEDSQKKIDEKSDYPAKILAGMTLRVLYNSVGTSDVPIAVNYRLHKVLV